MKTVPSPRDRAKPRDEIAAGASSSSVFTKLRRRLETLDHGWDVVNLLVLALFTAGLHWPFLGVPIFDVDEAEFLSKAAYAHATGQSAFSYPTHCYIIALYKVAADLFGPYDMPPLRVAAAVLAFSVTGLVYLWTSRETSRRCGLLIAIFFCGDSLYYNGYMVNREWPCILSLVGGAYLFVLSQRPHAAHERWLLFASGLATGAALFFKEQAFYITQAIPAWLVLQAACGRRWQPWLGKGLIYAAGGAMAAAIYTIPFLLAGTLLDHLQGELQFGSVYAYAAAPKAHGYVSQSLLDQFFLLRVSRLLLMVAYFACLGELVGLGRRLILGDAASGQADAESLAGKSSRLLVVCYVISSIAAAAMGGRFLGGYFLLWLPFMLVAAGLGLHFLIRFSTNRWGNPWTWLAIAVCVYLVGRVMLDPTIMFLFLLAFAIGFWEAGRRQRALQSTRRPPGKGTSTEAPAFQLPGRVARSLQWMLVTFLALEFVFELPNELNHIASLIELHAKYIPFPETRSYFAANARPGDRLFVWGKRPELYAVAGLEPAARDTICSGLVGGTFFEPTDVSQSWAAETLQELRERPPRFVAVGPRGCKTFGGEGTFDLDRFPALMEFLQAGYYRPDANLPDCEIFRRR